MNLGALTEMVRRETNGMRTEFGNLFREKDPKTVLTSGHCTTTIPTLMMS
jgi:hypothetical protein